MKKRGQFFLIAALIIISIVMGFSIVYNSASANKPDAKATRLAETIKYESTQVINTGFIQGQEEKISDSINTLIKEYAQSNPDVEINIIEENPVNIFTHKSYQGSREESKQPPSLSGGKVTVTLSQGLSYTFDNTLAVHDLYVIVKKEGNNERFIAAR